MLAGPDRDAFVRRALANPNPDPQEELRVLGFQGASELDAARKRLRSHVQAIHEKAVQHQLATMPQARPLEPGRTIHPSDQGVNNAIGASVDRALAPDTSLGQDVRAASNYGTTGQVVTGIGETLLPGVASARRGGRGESVSPLDVGLDVASIVPPIRGARALIVGGRALKAGEGVRAATAAARASMRAPGPITQAVRSLPQRTFRAGGLDVNIPAARSRTGRVVEQIADNLRPQLAKTGVVKTEAERAGQEYGHSLYLQGQLLRAPVDALKSVGRKLNDAQEYALRVVAEGAAPEARIAHHQQLALSSDSKQEALYHTIHADLTEKASKYVTEIVDPERGVVPVLRNDAPKALHEAWDLFQRSGDLREKLLQDLGRISDEQIAARVHGPARIISGGRYRTYESRIRDLLDANPARQELHSAIDQVVKDPIKANGLKALVDAQARSVATRIAKNPEAVDELLGRIQSVQHGMDPQQLPEDIRTLYQGAPPEAPSMPAKLPSKQLAKKIRAEYGNQLPTELRPAGALEKAIDNIYEMVKEGAPYRDWYQRFAGVMTKTAADLGVSPEQFAQVVAVTSQQANPTENFRRAITMIKQYRGEAVEKPFKGLPGQAQKVADVLEGRGWSGAKTNNYYANALEDINPEAYAREFGANPPAVTVDRHITHMLAPSLNKSPGRSYDAFAQLFRDIADHLGWKPKEIQAAAWVPWKARGEAARVAKMGRTPGPTEHYIPNAADAYERAYAKYKGVLFQDPHFGPLLDAATVELSFRDDPAAIEEIANKYGLPVEALANYAHTNSERLVGRILSNRLVWNEGHSEYDAVRAGAAAGLEAAGRGRPDVHFSETSGHDTFLAALRANPRGPFLSEHTADELASSRVFLSEDGHAGFVISPEGDLQNVFRNPGGVKGAGRAAVEHAISQGAKTLDAFDGFLPSLYGDLGFVETGRMRFVDEFAPEGWDFEQYGRPDIIFMAHGAQPIERRFYEDWDQAKADSLQAAGGADVLRQRGGSLDIASHYGVKGAIEFTNAHQAIIHLTSAADETTFVHELAHLVRRFGMDDKELKRIGKFMGARNGVWTPAAEEKFARSVESYVRSGLGPPGVKQAFRSLSPVFHEVYDNADLPDLPPHVAQVLSRLFSFDKQKGGRIFGADDVVAGVAYAPVWRGMPIRKLSQPHRAMAAYFRRAQGMFGAGGRRAIGAGPDDAALNHEFRGALLLNGFFTQDVVGPKVTSSILAIRMSTAHVARGALLKAGEDLPRDISDIPVIVDPRKMAGKQGDASRRALNAYWDKIASLEHNGGKLSERDLEGIDFDLIERARQDVFPAQLDGKDVRQVAADVLQSQEPIDNVKWVSREFLDQSGLLYVPAAARLARSGLSRRMTAVARGAGISWDALNDTQKALILYFNPAYVPVNLTGNLVMNFMHQGVFMPVNLWRSVLMHRDLERLDRITIDRLMGNGLTGALSLRTSPGQAIQQTLGHYINIAVDLVPRRAAFLHEARRAGFKKTADLQHLLERARNGDKGSWGLLEQISRRANDAIVDYERLSPLEREVFSRWIFFYPWLHGASRYAVRFIADHPVQSMALAVMADHAYHSANEQLGERPYYAQMQIPISTKTLGARVPGVGDVGLDQAVGDRSWRDQQGNPMTVNLRQAFTQTTPLELLRDAISFAGAGDPQAAYDVAQSLTPVPYAIATGLVGYDPFQKKEIQPGLQSIVSQFGPMQTPLADRIQKLNMSEEERRQYQKKALNPRSKEEELWRVFGGGLAPAPFNKDVAAKYALEAKPRAERLTQQLIQDSQHTGLGKPPQEALDDIQWLVRIDEAVHKGDSKSKWAQAAAKLYDERYGGNDMERLAAHLQTEGEAEDLYHRLRPTLYPTYRRWHNEVDRVLNAQLEAQPAGG